MSEYSLVDRKRDDEAATLAMYGMAKCARCGKPWDEDDITYIRHEGPVCTWCMGDDEKVEEE